MPMAHPARSRFHLTDAAKADPALIDDDDAVLARIDDAVAHQLTAMTDRLNALRRVPARAGREAAERDSEIRAVTAQVALLRRSGAHLCLGRMTDDAEVRTYLGRRGVSDADGAGLLLDWRTPAAAPFFAAARDQPSGLVSRRRYRWSGNRVVDYWDEPLTDAALDAMSTATLNAESSFLAALSRSRSTTMDDVLATLAADQSAILRDGSTGTLVVDGGPGTGKTVVALHRAAYLLYADSRGSAARGGVLFIGPTPEFLNYVAEVLPDLGAEGTRFATLSDLVAEGVAATEEGDPVVAALKSRLTGAITPAVAFYQDIPDESCTVETSDGPITVTPADWAVAVDQLEAGTPHNEARPKILAALAEYLEAPLSGNPKLRALLRRFWPLIDATDLIGDLWTVPAFLRHCAPTLSVGDVRALQRHDPSAWTTADLPLLDTARNLLGNKDFEAQTRRRSSSVAEQTQVMTEVIDELVAADDDREGLVQQFAFGGMTELTLDESGLEGFAADRLAGPFAHIVVDEAQELTDAQWAMLRRRCPAGGFTVVGDRAQARLGFEESWEDRLARTGLRGIRVSRLSLNYRTPREVMDYASIEIGRVLPGAAVPESIRSNGLPVRECTGAELPVLLARWLSANEGTVCVIGTAERLGSLPAHPRVSRVLPSDTSGLEFDLVAAWAPADFGAGLPGAVSRYIAMTRATAELVIVT
ncbi:MAG: RNA polymerase recycling motor ATPase HelR [Gordonia sp. (in: high G+C Gram-positive bacteria)]|uniref:RNA polymerase recycling motor ATPase HelR n=1 Tax=Gordonia sp. (in: high G+C Gram-positive bacteria) TaxID=84139 RepID=UPI003BB60ACE